MADMLLMGNTIINMDNVIFVSKIEEEKKLVFHFNYYSNMEFVYEKIEGLKHQFREIAGFDRIRQIMNCSDLDLYSLFVGDDCEHGEDCDLCEHEYVLEKVSMLGLTRGGEIIPLSLGKFGCITCPEDSNNFIDLVKKEVLDSQGCKYREVAQYERF